MIEKLERVLDLAADALTLYIRKTQADLGVGADPEAAPTKPARTKKAAKAAALEPLPTAPASNGAAGLGGLGGKPEASVEEQIEAARRCKEVIGLFIRARLNAKPTGVEQATAIIKEQLGAPRKSYDVKGVMTPMWKLEDFTYAENLKLIPIFEKAGEALAAA